MANIYDGCKTNDEFIYSIFDDDFYKKIEKREKEILAQGKKVVFVVSNTRTCLGARVVIYESKVPKIMQTYQNRYVKFNGKWVNLNLVGYCDCCGKYKELICWDNRGKVCKECIN